MAALGNNLIVLSNRGLNSSSTINETYIDSPSPENAFSIIKQLIISQCEIGLSNNNIDRYLESINWDVIALKHQKLYQKVFF